MTGKRTHNGKGINLGTGGIASRYRQYLHDVTVITCEECGLSYQTDVYAVRNAETCTEIVYGSYTLTVGSTAVVKISYTELCEFHDFVETAELKEGATSCDQGVILTFTCRDCGYNYSYHINSHETVLTERVNLANYGCVCGGYAVKFACACGQYEKLELEDCLCEFDETDIEMTVDTGVSRICHTYTESAIDETVDGLTCKGAWYNCTVCGSYRYEKIFYDADNKIVRTEEYFFNTMVKDGVAREYQTIRTYFYHNGPKHNLRVYNKTVYSNVKEYWTDRVYEYDFT